MGEGLGMQARVVQLWALSVCLLLCASVHGQGSGFPECPESLRSGDVDRSVIEATSHKFLRIMEPFQGSEVELVFVLDSSGSVGPQYFGCEVQFVRQFSVIFSVSAEASRVAVVTYSSCDTVDTDLDYINSPTGKNKCTLLGTDLLATTYRSGSTCTAGAISRAADILAGSRPLAKKLVFVLTDGGSNQGGSPVDAAQPLKESGVTVVAIGLGTGINEVELNGIASSVDDHVFLLGQLSDVEKLAQTIVGDQRELANWDRDVSTSLCNGFCAAGRDCCDTLATCSCATQTGSYGCACHPGYTGEGLTGECTACPRGRYKPQYGKQVCAECPQYSSTADLASTSLAECACNPGYTGSPKDGTACTPVQCKQLTFSLSSGIVPKKCGNTFQDHCEMQCRDDYRQVSGTSGSVDCTASGLWSSDPLQCTRITCGALPAPSNGGYTCDFTDWRIGTSCDIACDLGYEQKGDLQRQCQLNRDQQVGMWSNKAGECKAKTCPVLLAGPRLIIRPVNCTEQTASYPLEYQTRCFYSCEAGFDLDGVAHRTCQADGTWTDAAVNNTCVDTEPPQFDSCPSEVRLGTEHDQNFARFAEEPPLATDNAGVPTVEPSAEEAGKRRFYLGGDDNVTFTARDQAGLAATCVIRVTVEDRQPPKLIFCPFDVEKSSSNRSLAVDWTLPEFVDNSGAPVTLLSNHDPGDIFYWGIPRPVSYRAVDDAGNVQFCNFTVMVRQYSCPFRWPPRNGALSCEKWLGGQFCQVSCNENFDFIFEAKEIYYCRAPPDGSEVHWAPWPFRANAENAKWPDCAEIRNPNASVGMELQYFTGDCPSAVDQIAQNFVDRFKALPVPGFCEESMGCSAEYVEVSCDPFAGRRRRRQSGSAKMTIRFDVVVQPGRQQEGNPSSNASSPQTPSTVHVLGNLLDGLEAAVSSGRLGLDTAEGNQLVAAGPPSVYRPLTLSCPVGEVLRNQSCLPCPAGTYHDFEGGLCRDCSVGSYQDIDGQLECLPCPEGTTTRRPNSRSPEDCKAPCPRGTYSGSGLVTCMACPRGSYQPDTGSTACIPCAEGLTTWTEGALNEDQCSGECPLGTYSDTGYTPCLPCPRGSYGPSPQQTSCVACPAGLYTHYEGAHALGYCQEIDECESEPCQHGAECVDLPLGYQCQCTPGWAGSDCDLDIDDCDHRLCQNGATCLDRVAGYTCQCAAGYEGEHCQINIDDCQSNPCRNRAVCIDGVSSYSCECAPGFTGPSCEINFYDCASDPCQNDGTCVDLAENYTCCCRPGFRGRNCETLVDHCASLSCLNGATCLASFNSAQCICPPGFEGERCEINVDDCALNLGACQHGGSCIDLVQDFQCICTSGYTGTNCDTALSGDFDLHFPSARTSDFVLLEGAFPRLDALTVAFWMRSDDRSNSGTPLSYAAREPDGTVQDNALTVTDYTSLAFVINGKFKYTDADLSDGTWHHVAITWASLDGSWALYVDDTLQKSGQDFMTGAFVRGSGALVLGQEQDSYGGFFTQTQGFIGDLSQLNVWDYALTPDEVTAVFSSCALNGNAFAWSLAASGARGEVSVVRGSQLCPDITECQPAACLNGAKCVDLVGAFQCRCAVGFYGTNCELRTSACTPDTCLNGGSCHSNGSSVYCSCQPGHTGERCDVSTDVCQSSTCLNGGACYLDDAVPKCSCASGYAGRRCEYDVDECYYENGGCSHDCLNTLGSFVCICPVDFALDPDGLTCNDVSYCTQTGRFHTADDVWEYECSVCRCHLGRTVCEIKACPSIDCKENEYVYEAPGSCCPQCLEVKTCTVERSGKHYTYDGNRYEHRGNCRYVLSQDCLSSQFSVEVKYEATKRKIKKWALWLRLGCVEVEVDYEGMVKVTGTPVELPYRHAAPMNVLITRGGPDGNDSRAGPADGDGDGADVYMRTDRGVSVRWSRTGPLQVSAPSSLFGSLCGLCGNANGRRKDDRVTRQSLPGRSVREFAHSWKVDGYRHCAQPQQRKASRLAFGAFSGESLAACAGIDYSFLKEARKKCSAIRKRSFQMCHGVVDPTEYLEWCLQDACTCRSNEPCHCEAIAAYIYECQRQDVNINWLPNDPCNIRCPEGMLYDHCGPACVPTCDDPKPSGPMCQTQSCEPRCQCPAGTVMHQDTCILSSYCPK